MPTRGRSVAVLSAPVGAATRGGLLPGQLLRPVGTVSVPAELQAERALGWQSARRRSRPPWTPSGWSPHGYYLLRVGPPPSIQAPTARGAASRPTAIEIGKGLEGVVVYDQRLTAAAGAAVIRTVTPT